MFSCGSSYPSIIIGLASSALIIYVAVERLTFVDSAIILCSILFICYVLRRFFRLKIDLVVFAVVCSVVFALLLWFFHNPVVSRTSFLDVNHVTIGGHRGAAVDVPENTLAAFEHALAQGMRLLELDLELTQDNVLVVLHDSLVDRTTDGHGDVRSMTFAVTQTLDAAAKFKTPPGAAAVPRPQRIPRVEQVLDLAIERRAQVIIDVKAFANDAFLPALLNLYRSRPALYDLAAVCSFYPHVVYSVKRADPRIVIGHTWRPGFFTYADLEKNKPRSQNVLTMLVLSFSDWIYGWFLHRWLWKLSGAELFLMLYNEVDVEYVSSWRSVGVDVVAWTINELEQQERFLNELKCSFLTDKVLLNVSAALVL